MKAKIKRIAEKSFAEFGKLLTEVIGLNDPDFDEIEEEIQNVYDKLDALLIELKQNRT